MSILSIRNIHKSFGALEVLKGIDTDIARGEIVSIVGASGAGKTTLLQVMGTLLRPDEGSITLADTDVTRLGDAALSRFRNQHIGFIFQFHQLLPEFTALENVMLPALIAGQSKRAAATRAAELLDMVALPRSAMRRYPNELSGGQRQRVAVARALALNPEVIVLDEAVSALDVLVQNQILYLLNDLQAQLGLSYLFITHDLAVVRQIADDVIVMEKGKLVEANTTDELFNNPVEDYTRELIEAVPGRNIQLNL